MRILSLLILYLFAIFSYQKTSSPHGSDFKITCNTCHSPKGWQLNRENYSFDHNNTKFPLIGQHSSINCRQCHIKLIFKETKSECYECHKDLHQGTVGSDCSRCHTPSSWLVTNISGIHQMTRFPLEGVHRTIDCYQCHKSDNNIRFDVAGVNCIDCHRQSYQATTNPQHAQSGFSENCSSCHSLNAFQWTGAGFNHNFFPLQLGHSSIKCTDCHKTVNYSDAKPDCYICHQLNFMAAKNPDHNSSKFSTNCKDCHTLNPGWTPASYKQHDSQSFPIYSGTHKGTWNSCTECHENVSDYSLFTCIKCHHKPDMDVEHKGRNGYTYDSPACFRCHPKGNN